MHQLDNEGNAGGRSPAIVTVEHVEALAGALLPSSDEALRQENKALDLPLPGTLQAVDIAMDILVEKLLPTLQKHFDDHLVGKDFGRDVNSDLAKSITRLLRRLGVCVECAKCGEPAGAIRYQDTYLGANASWVWRYEHSTNLRHGATTKIGPLKLVLRKSDPRKSIPIS